MDVPSSLPAETAKLIDDEVRAIADSCYKTAERILEENRDKLDLMAEALLDYETIDKSQIDEIMAGRKPSPPESWDDKNSDSVDGDVEPETQPKPRPSGPVGGPAREH